jgi:hypothetical protein
VLDKMRNRRGGEGIEGERRRKEERSRESLTSYTLSALTAE